MVQNPTNRWVCGVQNTAENSAGVGGMKGAASVGAFSEDDLAFLSGVTPSILLYWYCIEFPLQTLHRLYCIVK